MQFITTDQRIAVEAFSVGNIYQVIFTDNSYFLGACVGIGDNFVMFQRPEPELLFALTMQTASDVAAINDDIVISRTYSGAPPLSFLSNGQPLISWQIDGNTTQNGTPTPATPVYPVGVGDLDDTVYIIPIISADTTTNIYLGEVQTTRKIKKLVLTGEETWTRDIRNNLSRFATSLDIIAGENGHGYCSHYVYQYINIDNSVYIGGTLQSMYILDNRFDNTDDFKTFLQQQYANGTPVCLWYVLATETTGIVNEPLMKIYNYADSISSTNTGAPTIPIATGTNTLTIGTTIQPSNLILTAQL